MKQNVFIEYKKITNDRFIKRLKFIRAPLQPVKSLRKMRTCLPSMKSKVEKNFKSRVVYSIVCPEFRACCVGQASGHLIT